MVSHVVCIKSECGQDGSECAGARWLGRATSPLVFVVDHGSSRDRFLEQIQRPCTWSGSCRDRLTLFPFVNLTYLIPPSGCGSRRTLTAPMSSCRRAVHDTRPSA